MCIFIIRILGCQTIVWVFLFKCYMLKNWSKRREIYNVLISKWHMKRKLFCCCREYVKLFSFIVKLDIHCFAYSNIILTYLPNKFKIVIYSVIFAIFWLEFELKKKVWLANLISGTIFTFDIQVSHNKDR